MLKIEMLKFERSSMTDHRRALRPNRRAPTSNPVKQLEKRKDVFSEYHDRNELNPDILADMLGPGMAKSLDLNAGFGKSPRHSPAPPSIKKGLTKEAKAGLQEKVDFTEVKLNKGHKQKAVREVVGGQEQVPKNFLVKIKGKQSMQTRLVNPTFSSLSKQDVFIYITESKLYQFNGTHASVLKKAKGTEICKRIVLKREHGCAADDSTKIDESRGSFIMTNFFKVLDQKKEAPVSEGEKDDEGYEREQNESNIVYMLDNISKKFDMLEELCGKKLSHSRLNDQQIYCLDFGPEVYLWIGKFADKASRKVAMLEARSIFDDKQRPVWGVFQRIADGLETCLFKEKFKDWPESNTANVLKPINTCAPKDNMIPLQLMEMCDAAEMHEPLPENPPGLELEMTDIGRGKGVPTDLSRDIFGHDVETTSTTVWRITENSYEEWPKECYGQFYSAEAFIVRWAYRVMQGGKKSDHETGRDRVAYFFWQGLDCSTKDKGTSAFMTVEVDVERAPQKNVQQGGEPAAFLALFGGGMVVYKGKISDSRSLRMFVYRGEEYEEGVLTELTNVSPKCFRSRTSMLISRDQKVNLWHGCKSRSHTVLGAQIAAEKLVNKMGTSENVAEYQEGSESKAFWDLFPERNEDYFSLLEDERIYSKSPRLFRLYEEQQQFIHKEVEYQCRAKDCVAPYPLIQEDLYLADQPALFLLDAHFTVYIWHGWWPTHSPDGTTLTHTGSAKTDHIERYKLALQTAVSYVEQCNYKETPVMLVVTAGSEPEEFRSLFPWWNYRDVGSKPSTTGTSLPLDAELEKFLQTEYTLAELQEKPLGCDPLKLEEYLSTKEFEAIFNMSKQKFATQPRWKQSQLKKPHKLF